uniref:Ground-like domain-containing protein n=1 Tax=Parascaris univalens TaxID=6257 RepID=A0A914ZQV6_PARUN
MGASGCCCNCGIPQPAFCGCQTQITCPIPLPCPLPQCPICQVCPPPVQCPPPPVAVCPAPQPVYVRPACGGGGCGGVGDPSSPTGFGGYPTPERNFGGAGEAGPPSSGFGAQGYGVAAEGCSEQAASSSASAYSQGSASSSGGAFAGGTLQQSLERNLNNLQAESLRRARAAATADESKCNSDVLMKLILKNIVADDPVASKRAIHRAALRDVKDAVIDVVCSDAGFTYIVSTAEHCEAQREKVVCFIYKKP